MELKSANFIFSELAYQNGYEQGKKDAVVHAHWIWELAPNGWADHICSHCGYTKNTDIHVELAWMYCPICGAKMDEKIPS